MSASRSVHLHARLDLGSGGRVSLLLDAQPARQAPEVGNIIVGNESVGNIIVGNVQSRAQWVRCLGIVTQVDIAYKTFHVVWQELAGPADPWQTLEDSLNSNILKSHTLVGKASLDIREPHLTKWHPAGCDVQMEQARILMTEAAKYALPKKRLPKLRIPGNDQAFGTHSRRSASLAPRSTTPPPRSTTPPPRSTTPPPRSTSPPLCVRMMCGACGGESPGGGAERHHSGSAEEDDCLGASIRELGELAQPLVRGGDLGAAPFAPGSLPELPGGPVLILGAGWVGSRLAARLSQERCARVADHVAEERRATVVASVEGGAVGL